MVNSNSEFCFHRLLPSDASFDVYLDWIAEHYLDAVQGELQQSQAGLWRKVDVDGKKQVVSVLQSLLLQQASHYMLLALRDERPVGYFFAVIKDCLAELPKKSGYVNGVYVEAKWRRHGLAQSMFELASRWFLGQGIVNVDLYTAVGNKSAQKFWEKNGFVCTEKVYMKLLQD